jgi:precorrin-2 dehydrogenase/sirohydrochlorin ferrochelatase
MIPLLVDLSGKTVLIFGGGDVGARKAAFFSGETVVRVYSRSFSPLFSGIAAECVRMDLSGITEERISGLVKGSSVVVAATPDTGLNDRIGAVCRGMGILFNNAEGVSGDVIIPSVVRGRNYLLAISTRGAGPAVSRYVREFLESSLPGLDGMIGIQSRLRAYLKNHQPDQEKRRDTLWKVLHDREAWSLLEKGEDQTWEMIERRYL